VELSNIDMHCHLGFYADVDAAARSLASAGTGAFVGTVLPEEYVRLTALPAFGGEVEAVGSASASGGEVETAPIVLGLGFHPWWVANPDKTVPGTPLDGAAERADLLEYRIEKFCSLVKSTRFVSEVGLDFSPQNVDSESDQMRVFESILESLQPGSVLSIHAVNAVTTVLDMLEEFHTLVHSKAIFHWFSGSSQDLTRAIEAGCYFSLGPKALEPKKGRAYAQAIPAKQILLETDMPWREEAATLESDDIASALASAATQISELRGEPIAEQALANSLNLLGGTLSS